MLFLAIKLIVNTPFYPHWLWFMKMKSANSHVLRDIEGEVLEVGAGNGSKKKELMTLHPLITKYIATDYSSWDNEFEKINIRVRRFNRISSIFFGDRERIKLDKICNATELPFKDETFDYHLSFEVLEHIDKPEKYFKEASRVLKAGGYTILSVPFLFRMHGGEPKHQMDYYRYLNGFFYMIAEKTGMEVIEIYNNTGIGTTIACLLNTYLIRIVLESKIMMKVILLPICPIVFLITNIAGYLIDLAPDKRYATRFHLVLRKK